MKLKFLIAIVLAVSAIAKIEHPCHVRGPRGPTNPGEPLELLGAEDLPESWDWGNITNGTYTNMDFLTITR